MVDVFMALLSFVESAPRAYRLKASNAAPLINIGRDIPSFCPGASYLHLLVGVALFLAIARARNWRWRATRVSPKD
jgi:hypothetical protein